MKKTLILFGSVFLAINASGQVLQDISLTYKQNLSISKSLTGKEGIPLFPSGLKVSGNNQIKSVTAIKQKLESTFTEYRDEATGKWVAYGKNKYSYNEKLKCILILDSYWDRINNYWLDYGKSELTYDDSGNITSINSFFWDNYGKQWYMDMNAGFEYDEAGNCTLECYSDLNEATDQWEIHRKSQYEYDADNKRISKVDISLDKETNMWVPDEKEEYSYDINGNMTNRNYFYWNEEKSMWFNNEKLEYVYNSEGNNTLILRYTLRWEDSTWFERMVEENTFDGNGDRILQIQHDWSGDFESRIENTFDNNFTSAELILPMPYPEDYFRHMWTNILYYSYSDTGWILQNRSTLFYAEVNTSDLSSLEDNDIFLYPNPSSQFIAFDADKPLTGALLSLFDMQGRKVMTGIVENNLPLSIKHLSKGLYLYRISDDEMDYRGKLVIE